MIKRMSCVKIKGFGVFLSLFLLFGLSANESRAEQGLDEAGFLNSVIDVVKANYVEEIDGVKLVEGALSGVMRSLDPHSDYLDPQSYKYLSSITQGEISGIGVEIMEAFKEGGMKIIAPPYEGSPAFRAKLMVNDIITMIDGESVLDMENTMEKLPGPAGSKVKLRILRGHDLLDVNLVREVIKIIPVKAKLVASDTIGYIKINVFNGKTAVQVKSEFQRLIGLNPHLEGLILDLRWNSGGLWDQAISVADLFLPGGVIVSTKSRNPKFNLTYKSNGNDISRGIPIIVIINGVSASASEIVAGAMQDNKRAIILGTKSYGKGSVQQIMPLSNGGAIKLTTALYYTPGNHCIQAIGITPDIIVKDAVLYNMGDIPNEAMLKKHIKNQQDAGIHGNASNNELQGIKVGDDLSNDAERDVKVTIEETKNATGNEDRDFQLLRAIDVIKAMYLYQKTSESKPQ